MVARDLVEQIATFIETCPLDLPGKGQSFRSGIAQRVRDKFILLPDKCSVCGYADRIAPCCRGLA